jgi:hypothetical protein
MMSRGMLRTGLVVLLCLAVGPIIGGCGGDKSTNPVVLSGACCGAGGVCMVTTQASCTGGTWMGANVPCAVNTCPQPVTGACCIGTNCSVTTQAACAGTWGGANTACLPNPCVSTTTGTISGTAALPVGVPGDISNTLVSIYADYNDWNNYRPLRSVASTYISPSQISFVFTNVTPGTYYLDCWKDRWSAGDFLGVYGSTVWPGMTPAPLSVAGGQTTTITVIVIGI